MTTCLPYKVFAFAALLFLTVSGADAETLLLAGPGANACRIVVPGDTDVSTRAVAEDMAAILKEVTGATFPVVTDETEATSAEIILGASNRRLKDLGLAELTTGFLEDEYEIRTVDGRLVIAGAPPRGTVNGIYGFLQDHLGCRWFTPGVSRIPRQPTLALPPILDRQQPHFQQRSLVAPQHWDAAWTARNRLNICKTYGGSVSKNFLMEDPRVHTIGNYYESHALAQIPASLFNEHPEYYAEINGERTMHPEGNARAYCITNPDFVKYVAERLKRSAGNFEDRVVLGLGHTDSANHCRCPVCSESYDRVGLAGTYMEFANAVAADVSAAHPYAVIDTLVYGMTFAPTPVMMHPKVRATWCPISACYAHGFGECQPNRERDYLGQLDTWLNNTDQLQIWYYHYQSDAWMPHLRLDATRKDFKDFHRRGVQGVFIEAIGGSACIRTNTVADGDKLIPAYGNPDSGEFFTVPIELNHLRCYIASRLMWDTDYDVEEGVREFCDTYYGPAGPAMARYVRTVESIESYDRTIGDSKSQYPGVHQGCGQAPRLKWDETVRLDTLFDEAEEAVGRDPTLLRRVRMARLSPQLSILCHAPASDPLREKAFLGFFALVEELGLKVLNRTAVTFDRITVAEFKDIVSDPGKIRLPGEKKLGENILNNSSFELDIDADGVPDGWSADGFYLPEEYALDPSGLSIDPTRAVSGDYSVKLTMTPAAKKITALRQRFDVSPGETYRASVRYQSRIAEGNLVLIFTAFDKDGKWLRNLGGQGALKDSGDTWLELTRETTVEADTGQLAIQLLFYDDRAKGEAWLDDFTCAKIEE